MEKRVETSAALAKGVVIEKGGNFLGNIITMDKLALYLHAPETKNQSNKSLEKDKPCFTKEKVQASRMKHIVLAFIGNKEIV
jgi:hypothetical protein